MKVLLAFLLAHGHGHGHGDIKFKRMDGNFCNI